MYYKKHSAIRRWLNIVQTVERNETKSCPDMVIDQNEHVSSNNIFNAQHPMSSCQEHNNFILYTVEGNADENWSIYPYDRNKSLDDSANKAYIGDNDYQPFSSVNIHKWNSNNSKNLQVGNQTENQNFEENCDYNLPNYPRDKDNILEDCADIEYTDDDIESGIYEPYVLVIHESSSDESTQVQYQTTNTFKDNCDKNDVSTQPNIRNLKQIQHQPSTPKDKSITTQSSYKELGSCRMKCKDWLQAIRLNIFNEYWNLDFNAQQDFIRSAVSKYNVLHKQNPKSSRIRKFFFKYYLNCDEKPKRCCKRCFTTTLNVNAKILRLAVEHMPCSVSYSTTIDSSRKSVPRDNQTDDNILNIHKHFSLFRTFEGINGSKYLSAHLNTSLMHKLYVSETSNPVSRHIYEREFKKTNLTFMTGKPCHKCDALKKKIKMESDVENKNKLTEDFYHHLKSIEYIKCLELTRKNKSINNLSAF